MSAYDQATTDSLARVATLAKRLSVGIPDMTDRLVTRIVATQDVSPAPSSVLCSPSAAPSGRCC